jgi:capsular polysaccharide biosynthesis protein
MTTLEQSAANSSILRLRVSSTNPNLVVDAANAMATAFVDTLYEYTGSVYVSVLDHAERVNYTDGGNRTMFGAAGTVAGLAIGAFIIYLFVISDHRIKTIEDVTRVEGAGRVAIVPLFSIK